MIKETALVDFHKKHGGRMVDFAGWSLPVMYTSIIDEHMAVRENAGLFDVSHMGRCNVSGADALKFLNFALTNDFTGQKTGCAKYSLICNANGECIDDLIVYKLADNAYMLVINASNTDADILQLKKASVENGMDVEICDVSDLHSMLAVQGPKAADILKSAFWNDFSKLGKFAFASHGDMLISRTGYTGSDGFEIICKNGYACRLAEHIIKAGAKLCGLGARDSLRLEACYPLYGHELSKEINPFEAGLGWAVKLDKGFVGCEGLKRAKAAGLKRKVAHFKALDRRIVREGEKIYCADSEVGRVLSGAWSPIQNAPILSAIVDIEFLSKELHAKVRNNIIPLDLKKSFL